jgi:Calcineurin-like phosphoesterase
MEPDFPHLLVETHRYRKVVIVGDVHGCNSELRLLVDRSSFDKSQDLLVFVGDLVAKGPASVETVRTVMSLNGLSVRGNHEDNMLKSVLAPSSKYANNRTYDFASGLTQNEIAWIRNLPYTISLSDLDLIVVHAGLVPGKSLKDQNPEDMIRMRTLDSSGKASKHQPSKHRTLWAKSWPGPSTVIFGHAAKQKLQREAHALGLDTGCVYGFCLTALICHSDGVREWTEVRALQKYQVPDDD